MESDFEDSYNRNETDGETVPLGRRNFIIWIVMSLVALALVAGAVYYLRHKGEEQVVIPICDLTEGQIEGNYTARGGDGKIGTADIVYDREDDSYVITVYGDSAPIRAIMTINGSQVRAWPLGEGPATYDTRSQTITINLIKEGNRCDLKKYL